MNRAAIRTAAPIFLVTLPVVMGMASVERKAALMVVAMVAAAAEIDTVWA
jgi:hypothetical protein